MAVRIIKDDFWATVELNKTFIRRSFIHIFNRFPDPEGQESVYAELLAWLCEKDVLSQFDHSRTRKGKSEEAAWRHFIFCRVQKFLESNYYNNAKYIYRYSSDGNIDSYHRKSYSTLRKPKVELFNEETAQHHRDESGCKKRMSRTTRINKASKYPTIDDIGAFHSSSPYSFDEEIEANQLSTQIHKQLKSDIEREIVKGCCKGLSQKEIAVKLNRTPAAVSATLKRIRQRCVNNKVLA